MGLKKARFFVAGGVITRRVSKSRKSLTRKQVSESAAMSRSGPGGGALALALATAALA